MIDQALIQQLKRIADALEEQNRVYVERCAKNDENNAAEEQRRFLHDFELIEANHSQRTEQLKLERENMLQVRKLYDEHPELAKEHLLVLESCVSE